LAHPSIVAGRPLRADAVDLIRRGELPLLVHLNGALLETFR
jgi:hypothetical protein